MWFGNVDRRDHLEGICTDKRIYNIMGLKDMGWESVDWTRLAQKWIQTMGCCEENIKP